MTRVTRLIHNAGKYQPIIIYPLPTHPTHNFTHKNCGNLDTLPDWPKKFNHNRPARCAGQLLYIKKSRRKEEKKWWYGTGVNMSKKLQHNRTAQSAGQWEHEWFLMCFQFTQSKENLNMFIYNIWFSSINLSFHFDILWQKKITTFHYYIIFKFGRIDSAEFFYMIQWKVSSRSLLSQNIERASALLPPS